MLNQYNPTQISVIATRLDNDASHTFTGFAKGALISSEKLGEPKHKINRGIYPGAGSFGIDDSQEVRVTLTLEATHPDNAYLSDLANNSIQIRLTIKGSYGSITDEITIPFAMVEDIYLPKHDTDVENKNNEWAIIGGQASSGMFNV